MFPATDATSSGSQGRGGLGRLIALVRQAPRAGPRSDVALLVALGASVLLLSPRPTLGVLAGGVVGGFGIALQAIGVLLVYRTGRFINFAQVAIGLAGAAVFLGLVHGQELVRAVGKICGGCTGVTVPHWLAVANYLVALVAGLVAAVVAAVIAYAAVVRFARAPRLLVSIATIFIAQLLVLLAREVGGWLVSPQQQQLAGVSPLSAAPPPVQLTIVIGGRPFHLGDVLMAAVAIAAVTGMGLYLKLRPAGMAIRAAAENGARARTLAINVEAVTARVWVVVGLLSGAGAIVGAFSGSLSTASTSSVGGSELVYVLAAAVIARMSSLPVAMLAAVVLGVLQESSVFSFGSSTAIDVALVVIVGVFLALQRGGRGRGDLARVESWQSIPETRPVPVALRALAPVRTWRRAGIALALSLVLFLPWLLPPGSTSLASTYVLYAMVGLSLLVLTGWAGQVSLGQMGFAAVGAWVYAASRLPFPVALVAAGAAGALVAGAVGVPALKLRGLHLAIVSLAFSLSASALLLGGGPLGHFVPRFVGQPSLAGVGLADVRTDYYAVLGALALAAAAVAGMRRSRFGRVLLAARDNEAAAEAFGINLLRARLSAFAVSGCLAALAGALLTVTLGAVSAGSFTTEVSLSVFMYTVIGGLGGLLGPLAGTAVFGMLALLSSNPAWAELGSGMGGLLVLLLIPGGIAQGAQDVRDSMLRRVARRFRIEVPSLTSGRKRTAAAGRAPLLESLSRGGPSYFPTMYEPPGQWALARFGRVEAEATVEGTANAGLQRRAGGDGVVRR